MHVLRNMVEAVRVGGVVLDLQVIRPTARIEADGRFVCDVEGDPLFESADAAVAAVDALVAQGRLVEEAVDDHDVLVHYPSGRDVVDDFEDKERRLPEAAVPLLLEIAEPCVMRERCRLRRLIVRSAIVG